ncbi:MAG: 30S ribosomal protein S1 [Gammaproteobacteria bacterium]
MSEFEKLFEESIAGLSMKTGSIVKAEVVDITDNYVLVNAGLKSESFIPVSQFKDENGDVTVNVGDEVEVALDAVENGYGETRLSREKAKRMESWKELEQAHNENRTVKGYISNRVKGGFTVEINEVRAFLPGSLVDVRPLRDPSYLEGKDVDLKVIKIDAKRSNVVVSRRAVIEEENTADRDSLLSNLVEGQAIKGIVKNLTEYGAFVDLGGIDGLLHITDMAWKRVKHPSEVLNVGDEIHVKVLKFDKEKNRVSLGLKQMDEDPWMQLVDRFPVDAVINGKVTNVTDYGCFVEIAEGVEGLVHVSEMDWTNKNIHPSKVVKLGDEVDVKVLEVDPERRRISLGIKQCVENPWGAFAGKHEKGEKIKGAIKSITDFGVFIGLDGDIDGLVHLSDLSWDEEGEVAVREYQKGQEVEAVILAIDPERERISLGIKQLDSDPFGMYISVNSKGSVVMGKITKVEDTGLDVELDAEVSGRLEAKEIGIDKSRIKKEFNEGDSIEVKIIGVDQKSKSLQLSIKAKESEDKAKVLKQYTEKNADASSKTTLGDIMKDHMENDE